MTKSKKHELNIFRAVNNDWCWNVSALNGRIVAFGEGYKRVGDLLTMLTRLFKGAAIEPQIEEWAAKLLKKRKGGAKTGNR